MTSVAAPVTRTRTYSWTEGPRTTWGLANLQAICAGLEPGAPIMYTLGWRILSAEPGVVRLALEPEPFHLNPHRMHGGVLSTLLDSATACAVISTLNEGEASSTLEIKVNYLRSVTMETGELVCEGVVVHRGRTVAVAEGTIRDPSGAVVARASSTSLINKRGVVA